MAETYFDFSRSLIESERPTDLKPAELEEFEQALDEEAFPFEEKAIGVHEKNVELLQAGVFNAWTEKSLGRLVELMPGRYAKQRNEQRLPRRIDATCTGARRRSRRRRWTTPRQSIRTDDAAASWATSEPCFAYTAGARLLRRHATSRVGGLLGRPWLRTAQR